MKILGMSPGLFNASFNVGKASKLPDSFLQEKFDLEVAKDKKNCDFLEFL